eukprot:72912_1
MLNIDLLTHKNAKDKTALELAVEKQNERVIIQLIHHFIYKINLECEQSVKLRKNIIHCLEICIELKDVNCIKLLIEYGHNIILEDKMKGIVILGKIIPISLYKNNDFDIYI